MNNIKTNNDLKIDIKHDIFHSLKKGEDGIHLFFLVETKKCHDDDDMEYLGTELVEYLFSEVEDVKIEGEEADNYIYKSGKIDYIDKKIDLNYIGVNFEGDETTYLFSFKYKSFKLLKTYKIDSPCC